MWTWLSVASASLAGPAGASARVALFGMYMNGIQLVDAIMS